MKNYINNIKVLFTASLSFFVLSCDIGLQDTFEFVPDVDLTDPYGNMTAWEFISSDVVNGNLSDTGGLIGEHFDYMSAAIEAAGMIDEYNAPNGERTYLLLNNNAFTGGGDIIQLITNSSSVAAGETPAQVMARADMDVLRTILRYHIVTTYITQTDPLKKYNLNYIFQTLIDGEDGRIVMRRDDRYRIDINRSPAPLPSSATSQFEQVRNYNYVFSNGIGHIIQDPVRNRPYPSANLN